MSTGPGRMRPEEFAPNPAFAHFLHAVLARHAPNCPGVQREAQRQRHGYVYILDARTPDPQGDVPAADVRCRTDGQVSTSAHPTMNPTVITVSCSSSLGSKPASWRNCWR
jgi:hypothetical protein